ncbi:MAG TPA: hypothetical protein PKE26_11535 [Kiritimatiellia bacterium]|nr:hypothetical protein [Kiritimatiellia bacterium]HMO99733.1 hypothetical protein [Kiritimatiellia bacterium]HMP97063.1 hypothetical protein [Kiritimatiellia bacterium]
MKRTYQFAASRGVVSVSLARGGSVELPVFAGVLKHPRPDELPVLLQDERVARKYTRLAIEKMAWPVLRQFPRDWILENLKDAILKPGRQRAVLFLLAR